MKKIDKAIQTQIKNLRKSLFTHRQISGKLNISLGSVFKYARNIKISKKNHYQFLQKNYQKSLGKIIKEQRINYSRKGGLNTNSHFKIKYSKSDLIKIIIDFYNQHQRIPTKNDCPNIYRPILRVFGTWNMAIKIAGFSPNPLLFSKKYIANDGHKCDSLSEKIIDDWLFSRKINHQRNIKYKNSKFITDFKVGNFYIEFFGLHNQLKSYDKLMQRKLAFIKDKNLKLISIYPKDIFPNCSLDSIFRKYNLY